MLIRPTPESLGLPGEGPQLFELTVLGKTLLRIIVIAARSPDIFVEKDRRVLV